MASQSAADRRRAQRRLARELKTGRYQRGRAGKAYQSARKRQTGGVKLPDAKVPNSDKVHHQRRFGNVNAASNWARDNLPKDSRAYIMQKGVRRVASGKQQPGQRGWGALTSWARPSALPGMQDDARAESAKLFTSDRGDVVLRWRDSE